MVESEVNIATPVVGVSAVVRMLVARPSKSPRICPEYLPAMHRATGERQSSRDGVLDVGAAHVPAAGRGRRGDGRDEQQREGGGTCTENGPGTNVRSAGDGRRHGDSFRVVIQPVSGLAGSGACGRSCPVWWCVGVGVGVGVRPGPQHGPRGLHQWPFTAADRRERLDVG